MIDISYIMGFIGVAVGLVIGILIYSEVEQAIDCPDAATNADGNTAKQPGRATVSAGRTAPGASELDDGS